jgi:translation initiation factor 4A
MAPTRELADQIQKVVLCLGEFMKVKVQLSWGGTSIAMDKKVLLDGVHIIVGKL